MSTKTKLIAWAFEGYRQCVMPADAGPIQVRETSQAFFAGAAIVHAVFFGPDSSTRSREEDVAMAQALIDELAEFAQQLDIKLGLRARTQ